MIDLKTIDLIYKQLDTIKEYTCSASKITVYGDNAYLLADKVKDEILSLEWLSARSMKLFRRFNIVKKKDDEISLDNYAFRLAKSIVDDIKFKLFYKNDPEYEQILKIIVARERNETFEFWIAGIINGSNQYFIGRGYRRTRQWRTRERRRSSGLWAGLSVRSSIGLARRLQELPSLFESRLTLRRKLVWPGKRNASVRKGCRCGWRLFLI